MTARIDASCFVVKVYICIEFGHGFCIYEAKWYIELLVPVASITEEGRKSENNAMGERLRTR